MKLFHIVPLTLYSLLGFAGADGTKPSSTSVTITSSGPFIEINGKYLLYSTPIAPFRANGATYVPLQSFSQLLGAQVNQSGPSSYVISLNQRSATLDPRRQTLSAGGKDATVRAVSLESGELALPATSLLRALSISYTVAPDGSVSIYDDRFLNPRFPLKGFRYANGIENVYKLSWDYYFYDQFYPTDRRIKPVALWVTEQGGERTIAATFTLGGANRWSGSGVSILAYHQNGAGQPFGDGGKPGLPIPDCSYRQQGKVVCTVTYKVSANAPLKYILAHPFRSPQP